MKILLVFTFNTSLKIWHEQGILTRELKVYKDLVDELNYEVSLLTYGNNDDINILEEYNLDNYFETIPIFSILKKSKSKIVNIFKSIYFAYYLLKNNYIYDVVKTNQLYGSWLAILFKILAKNKLIIRTGYNPLVFAKHEGKSKVKILLYSVLTKIALIYADTYITTNKDDMELITKKESLREKMVYQPNFVEVKNKNLNSIEKRINDTIFSVGRLEEQKNHIDLIKKLKDSRFKLKIIGEGILKEKLIKCAEKNNVDLEISKNLKHELLLRTYSNYLFYIQISKYEGNPKTILEAMSAGCVVMVTDVYGVRNIVNHKKNGIILKNGENLSMVIDNLLNDKELLNMLSKNARFTVENNFSYQKYLETEKNNYRNLNIIN